MRPYSLDLRERVIHAINTEHNTPAQTAQRFTLGIATIYRYLQLDRDLHNLTPRASTGRPRLINTQAENQLRAQLEAHNDATLEEHRRAWRKATGVQVSRTTMFESLERLGVTRKKRPSKRSNATNKPG